MTLSRSRPYRTVLTAAFLAAMASSCAVTVKDHPGTIQMGRSGVALLVDSSVPLVAPGDRAAISLPENLINAVDLFKISEAALLKKGYALGGSPMLTVGAAFDPAEKITALTADGSPISTGTPDKPFLIYPAATDPLVRTRANDLVRWARAAAGTAPKDPLNLAKEPGIALITCSGRAGNRDAREVRLMLIERSTGSVVWLDRRRVSSRDRLAVVEKLKQILNDLPPVK